MSDNYYYNSSDGVGMLEEKKPGRHRFVAVATYAVSHESVTQEDGGSMILDQENLLFVDIGCIDCEKPYSPDLRNYCEGEEYNPFES